MASPTFLDRSRPVDGMPLGAAVLRAEQAHLIQTSRLVNRHLLTPGIADGLEVRVSPDSPHRVVVAPGVALDDDGRAIVLITAREVAVVGTPSAIEGVARGNYLVVSYGEQEARRIREHPRLRWTDRWPVTGSGEVVLAQAELAGDCTVRRLDEAVRRPVRRRRPPCAMRYSFAGCKDVDPENPKHLYFHIRGGVPDAVVLELRAGEFPPLYYTEMGGHTHPVKIDLAQPGGEPDLSHAHKITKAETLPPRPDSVHRHRIRVELGEGAQAVTAYGENQSTADHLVEFDGSHVHGIEGLSTDDGLTADGGHTHIATPTQERAGTDTAETAARTEPRRRHLSGLTVELDRPDRPDLGSTDITALVTIGTPSIDLVAAGFAFEPGEHRLRLAVPAGGGAGRLHYQLGVE